MGDIKVMAICSHCGKKQKAQEKEYSLEYVPCKFCGKEGALAEVEESKKCLVCGTEFTNTNNKVTICKVCNKVVSSGRVFILEIVKKDGVDIRTGRRVDIPLVVFTRIFGKDKKGEKFAYLEQDAFIKLFEK